MSEDSGARRNRRQGISTRAIHLGYDPASEQGALTPPIYQTSTYAFETVEQGAEYFAGTKAGYVYGRTRNPTQALLEQRVADLEGAEAGLALASGMAAISAAARKAGALTVVDNTFATPVLQRPLEHGADLVIHSATKYLGGHGDLLAGLVVGGADQVKEIRMQGLRYLTGGTISPLTAFLVLRGLKTLELRVGQHSRSAAAVVEFLGKQAAISNIAYPAFAVEPAAGGLSAPDDSRRRAGVFRA